MDVRLSPVCGLITDCPLNKDNGGFQFARPPTLGVTHHTHDKRRYQCLASIIRIVFLLLNTCGMRPRRSNKKHLDSQTATEFENAFVRDELRGIVPADVIVGTQQDKMRCRMRTKCCEFPQFSADYGRPIAFYSPHRAVASRRGPQRGPERTFFCREPAIWPRDLMWTALFDDI